MPCVCAGRFRCWCGSRQPRPARHPSTGCRPSVSGARRGFDSARGRLRCPGMTTAEERLRAFGLGDEDLAAWEASGRADFDEWLLDRLARRPEGPRARAIYGADDVHDFARRAILEALALGPDDRLLEIGCGGGVLLRGAAAAAAASTGVAHSPDMVALARERAPGAEVVEGRAESLPFGDDAFSAIAMSVVLIFFADPLAVLRECRRVLRADGRLAAYTTAPELRGTPAAPEPLASHSHFHTDDERVALER